MTVTVESIPTTSTDEVTAEVTALLEAPERAGDFRDPSMFMPILLLPLLSPSGPRKPGK